MMAHYTLEREAGWVIVVGPGHEKGTGTHFNPHKSYLMKDAHDLANALEKAYDAGRLHALNLMEDRSQGLPLCQCGHVRQDHVLFLGSAERACFGKSQLGPDELCKCTGYAASLTYVRGPG